MKLEIKKSGDGYWTQFPGGWSTIVSGSIAGLKKAAENVLAVRKENKQIDEAETLDFVEPETDADK